MSFEAKRRLCYLTFFCNVFLLGIFLSALSQEPGTASLNRTAEAGSCRAAEIGLNRAAEAGLNRAADPEKLIALTFDDGPHTVCTEQLLNGLKKRGVRASFFLVGENIGGNEQLLWRMSREGHLLGVHCYRHVDLTGQPAEVSCLELEKTADMIEDITGNRPEYIRPPYGRWSGELEEKVSMVPVFWEVDTLDWKTKNSREITEQICGQAEKHQIVLLHDVFPTSVEGALAAVDTLTGEGYTFVTVDELLIE